MGAQRREHVALCRTAPTAVEVGVGLGHDHVGQRAGATLAERGKREVIRGRQARRRAVPMGPLVPGRDVGHQLVGLREMRGRLPQASTPTRVPARRCRRPRAAARRCPLRCRVSRRRVRRAVCLVRPAQSLIPRCSSTPSTTRNACTAGRPFCGRRVHKSRSRALRQGVARAHAVPYGCLPTPRPSLSRPP